MNGKTIWREARFLALILFGSACYAVGFDLFLMPHQVNAGGVSGASMLICAALGWDGGVGILTLGINVPLFLLGYRYLGKRFFAGSIVGTIATSAFIELFARIPAPQTDIMLGVLYGGVLVGLGLGVVFYAGASTGGVDIIASLLRKKFRSISVGNLMLAVDSAVIAAAPTRSVHQLLLATMLMPIKPTRYTYHGAPRRRILSRRMTSRYTSSSTSAMPCTNSVMPNRL